MKPIFVSMNQTLHAFSEKLIYPLAVIIFCTVLFLPPIPLWVNGPGIEVIDLLLPFVGIIILINRKKCTNFNLLILFSLFGLYAAVTIAINHRLSFVSDWFEIYKLIKFGMIVVFFSLIGNPKFFTKIIPVVFVVLVAFNIIHYYNIFNFNLLLEKFYYPGLEKYIHFGLNSAGIPVSKRMLGFTANPNNNAIMFTLFAIYFLPVRQLKSYKTILFFLAVMMIFLCQSRTALIAFPILVSLYFIFNFRYIKEVIVVTSFALIGIGIAYTITKISVGVGTPVNLEMVNKFITKYPVYGYDEKKQKLFLISTNESVETNYTYLESVTQGQFLEGTSMKGRYEIWKLMWQMIKKKPIFGHGPNKEFFYTNTYYAENEALFLLWKYGFIGLIFFSLIHFLIMKDAFKNRTKEIGFKLLMMYGLFAVASITNLPFTTIFTGTLIALFIGFYYSNLRLENADSIR